ncbi:ArsB/NhaD family transporter [Pseudomonas aeruginosa]|uniref:ArsB/NhaD family transporter n=1 Tax=Pseudomonas aeruginosa TaxID=287 RepID=UPI0034597910
MLALRFSPASTLAFVIGRGLHRQYREPASGVSNQVNIVSADYFGLGFAEYVSVMVPVDLASVAAILCCSYLSAAISQTQSMH